MKLCTPRFKKPYIELESKEDILKWELYKSKEAQDELVEIIEYKNNIINKAIEYLNKECMYDENLGYCNDLWCGQVQELVDILKGEDKK